VKSRDKQIERRDRPGAAGIHHWPGPPADMFEKRASERNPGADRPSLFSVTHSQISGAGPPPASVVRSSLFMAGMALWTGILGAAIFPLALAGSPPAQVRKVTRLWARGVLALLRRTVGIDHVVRGREHMPGSPCLIVCNHQSAWETIAALLIFPDVAIIAKRELLRIPVIGWYLKHSPMIIIDRASGLESIRGMAREGLRAIRQDRSILIFPEGTRVGPATPIRFRRGVEFLLRALRVPVLPVVHDAGRFWTRTGKLPGTIEVKILPPLGSELRAADVAGEAEMLMNAERRPQQEG